MTGEDGMLKLSSKLAGGRTFLAVDYSISFSSTTFTHDRVQNRSLIPAVHLSSISQNSLSSPAPQSPCIPGLGTGESSGAGGLTCRGNRADQSGTGRTPGWKTQTHWGPAQAWASLLRCSLYVLCLTDFGLHSQLFFHK